MKTMTEQELNDWVVEFYHQMSEGAVMAARELFAGMKLVPADAVVLTLEQAEGIVSYPIGSMEAGLQAAIDLAKGEVKL